MNLTSKKPRYSSCTILRTFVRTYGGTLNMVTGEIKPGNRKETVTEVCGVPLFGDDVWTGVCTSCRRGWEVPDNTFANDAERKRALAAWIENGGTA
jgi:hypothetical protein